jgi:hypothetical protein
MFPVPSKIHTVSAGGFSHSGGASVIDEYGLAGFFNDVEF